MKIELQVKNVFGRNLIYPICEKAKMLAELLGSKTIPEKDLKIIQKLGFEVEWVPNSIRI